MANCNKVDVIIHESLSNDQEQNGDQIQQDIMQAFQDCQEPCMDNNNWKDGQVKLCTSKEHFCHYLGLDFSHFRDDQYLNTFTDDSKKP